MAKARGLRQGFGHGTTDAWHVGYAEDGSLSKPVSLWQQSVHVPGIYDLELDTSILSPEECVGMILKRLEDGPPPTAFQRIAGMITE